MISKVTAPSYGKLSSFPLSSNDPSHRFEVHNPATGEVITTVQGGGVAEVKKARHRRTECLRWVALGFTSREVSITLCRRRSFRKPLGRTGATVIFGERQAGIAGSRGRCALSGFRLPVFCILGRQATARTLRQRRDVLSGATRAVWCSSGDSRSQLASYSRRRQISASSGRWKHSHHKTR